jgi:NitT/TauT family transport system permease protein
VSTVISDIPAEAPALNFEERMQQAEVGRKLTSLTQAIVYPAIGMSALLLAWWMGSRWIANHPDLSGFSDFAPAPTLAALQAMWESGTIWKPILPSLIRIGTAMLYATLLGVPVGIAIGRFRTLKQTFNMPMQFLRLISPLAWMPIAVMVFETWESSIVFVITAAAIWPIIFSTSNGLSKIDPDWYTVSRNLGANPLQQLWYVILPATAQDIFTGLRLALGVAWVVLVPAEFLGVTSGLGYAINDARDCLEYDRLAATVVVIGVIGFALDSVLRLAIQRVNWVEARNQ